MGTEVLRPQDCLIHQRIRVAPVVFPRWKSNRKVQVRPEPQQQRRRSPELAPAPPGPKRSASVVDLKTARSNQFGMGQVTILRRGHSPTPAMTRTADDFSGDIYAGSAFYLSPSPRAVPLPSFFNRKSNPTAAAVDDSATKDLRRLLRLE